MNSNSNTPETCNTEFQNFLIEKAEGNDIAAYVAQEALSYDTTDNFFHDISQNGCISGMVTWLIYYKDTHAFFEKHYDEIQTLKDEWECGCCEALRIEGDIKNFLAWFAFEEVANNILNKWEGI